MIDLQDTDKSQYFVITEFNNNYSSINRSRSLFLRKSSGSEKTFSRKSDRTWALGQ